MNNRNSSYVSNNSISKQGRLSHVDQQQKVEDKEKFRICLEREQAAYAESLAEAVSIINFHLIILRFNFSL